MGPMTFYRMIRLNAVRKALKTESECSVKMIARSFGFHHLSNFAADYLRAFGEYPSETLALRSNATRASTLS